MVNRIAFYIGQVVGFLLGYFGGAAAVVWLLNAQAKRQRNKTPAWTYPACHNVVVGTPYGRWCKSTDEVCGNCLCRPDLGYREGKP